ncbi:MAG: sodium:proton antiporter [Geminicoccaceae bacterium]|nr:sodium:proton antiporter [Geminicoccaceae bacterium]
MPRLDPFSRLAAVFCLAAGLLAAPPVLAQEATQAPAATQSEGARGASGGDESLGEEVLGEPVTATHGPDVAGDHPPGAPHLDGGELNLLWAVPFAGILLSIALMPLLAGRFWHHHFGKIAAFWALAFVVPFALVYGFGLTLYEVMHALILEYVPFIILLFSLFTVTGGVRVITTLQGTPAFNTGLLALGTLLASWMGTTGAAMALIRPMLRANAWRRNRTHVVVFFIFLVANIGGSLTPLGDPPLFLGFLKGVPFFWPTVHLFPPMLVAAFVLLAVFYVLDLFMMRRETGVMPRPEGRHSMRLQGKVNLLLLLGIVASVLLSGIWKPGITFEIYHVEIAIQNVARDLLLLAVAGLSLWLTPWETREANDFSWFPIMEVAKLFAAIFVTIIPAIAILKAGTHGSLAPIVNGVSTPSGDPIPAMYFWATGILSSFLDNAPTYLVFFNTAGGDPLHLIGPYATTLLAISAGAVFMGANTYIGNAPNFMVRAIAEESGTQMPSFFGYMAWSLGFLIPVFLLITWLFFL